MNEPTGQLKPGLRFVLWLLGFCAAVILGVLLYSFVCKYPQYAYKNLSGAYSFEESCKALVSDSDLRSANKILERLPEPIEQRLDANRFVIRWQSGECSMEFDPVTKRLSKPDWRTFAGTRWGSETD